VRWSGPVRSDRIGPPIREREVLCCAVAVKTRVVSSKIALSSVFSTTIVRLCSLFCRQRKKHTHASLFQFPDSTSFSSYSYSLVSAKDLSRRPTIQASSRLSQPGGQHANHPCLFFDRETNTIIRAPLWIRGYQ